MNTSKIAMLDFGRKMTTLLRIDASGFKKRHPTCGNVFIADLFYIHFRWGSFWGRIRKSIQTYQQSPCTYFHGTRLYSLGVQETNTVFLKTLRGLRRNRTKCHIYGTEKAVVVRCQNWTQWGTAFKLGQKNNRQGGNKCRVRSKRVGEVRKVLLWFGK